MNRYKKNTTRPFPTVLLILCGLFAALTAILSQIVLPLPFTPVPINLATLSVLLSGGLLGARWGVTSQVVYLLIGACGLPVFAGFSGGLHVISGPTGGYLAGYAAASFAAGWLMEGPLHPVGGCRSGSPDFQFPFRTGSQPFSGSGSPAGRSLFRPILAMTAATLVCYVLGTAWFMLQTHTGLLSSLIACVFPFLPGDALKIAAATALIPSLRPFVQKLI